MKLGREKLWDEVKDVLETWAMILFILIFCGAPVSFLLIIGQYARLGGLR